jgi:DNA polymerase-3 subunit delta'
LADRANIPIELLVGDKEHRMREGLLYELSATPYSGRRRIAIIDDADALAVGQKESANCLLKTLEEPPPKSLLILIGTSEQRQLPTIRSRCQVVRFAPLAAGDVAAILVEQGLCADAAAAGRAAAHSGGSVQRAAQMCDGSIAEFRGALLGYLAHGDLNQLDAAKLIGQFVEDAGKDSASKRTRLKLAVSLAAEFYRAALLALSSPGSPHTPRETGSDPQLASALKTAIRWLPGSEAAAACLDVCHDATAHIDANANQATLIDWWLDELAAAARCGRVAV